MGKWLRLYTKIHTYHYAVIGIAGIVATVIFASSGEHYISVGPLQLDVFYISIVSFGLLLLLSATDEYDPKDYGLTSSESEK
ncbi:hypothetical protein DWB78_16625 [Halopelagius longus]|uniref:Uncharacterized protein n=1 Tax=Halopelagius longus TaxID=1236180 RepID=A0A1H1G8N6_9EURY|nr:hypothetical protein DWB78_16625 [Halopelagius longus]SDR09550.1 hypothetical protein SAMN05216278_3592 [Halopelagius longus]